MTSLQLNKGININDASDKEARVILIALCERDRRIRSKASNLLTTLKQFEVNHPTKRKLNEEEETVDVCIQCDEAFTKATNRAEACRFHCGSLEPDDEGDFWADHDEDCHGIIDSNEMREEFPDGFIWDCCDKDGTSVGCQRGYHRSRQDPAMKGSY